MSMQHPPARDNLMPVKISDGGMNRAIEEARRTLPEFLRAFSRPMRNQSEFMLKARFEVGGQGEHVWLEDLDLSRATPRGRIANKPQVLDFGFMQRVSFQWPDVSDWMYVEDGSLVGGHTTRFIRSSLNSHDRAVMDARSPFSIRD